MHTEDPDAIAALTFHARAAPGREAAQKKIRGAWGAGCVSTGITLVAMLLAMAGHGVLGMSALNLVDVALLGGLTFGIWRRSRTCAVIMLGYFLASRLLILASPDNGALRVTSIPGALVFLYFYWQGVAGTFAFHRLRRSPAAS